MTIPTRLFTLAAAAVGSLLLTVTPASAVGQNFELVAAHSGKCLDVGGASQADLTPVIQYTCHGLANQRWAFHN